MKVKKQMITDEQKDKLFDKMVYNRGLFYYSENHKSRIKKKYKTLDGNFNTEKEFVSAVNSLLHSNSLNFYNEVRFKNENDGIKFIKRQFNRYNNHTPNNEINWLRFTEKIIMGGISFLRFENIEIQDAFLEWYNEKIKEFQLKEPQQTNTPKEEEKDLKKLSEKWYALLYWMKLKANGELPPINSEGAFIKSKLETIGKEMSGKKGQGFYRAFIDIANDLDNVSLLNKRFPLDWREKIISLSDNDKIVENYINIKYKL